MTYAEYQKKMDINKYYNRFGLFVRRQRLRTGMDQQAYCDWVADGGMQRDYLSRIENGHAHVRLYRAYALMKGPDRKDYTQFYTEFANSLRESLWAGYGNLRRFSVASGVPYTTLSHLFSGETDASLYLVSYVIHELRRVEHAKNI